MSQIKVNRMKKIILLSKEDNVPKQKATGACSECSGWFGENSFPDVSVNEGNKMCPISGTLCFRFGG